MHEIIEGAIGVDILERHRRLADNNAHLLEKNKVRAIDFLGAVGSGKTLLIEHLVDDLEKRGVRCGAIVGDVAGDDDFKRLAAHDIQVQNINTGKECHLDAHMVEHSLEKLDLISTDVLFIENVGNLVCPADFPLGAGIRVVVISVTEGDDMVRKHPMIFGTSDVVVINKIDLAEAVEVDVGIIEGDARMINPHLKIVLTDAKHGVGIDDLICALELG